MTDAQQKIDMLTKKINTIDEKMKSLLLQKKDIEKQIKEIEEQTILNVVRNSKISITTLDSDLTLAKLLRDNNIGVDEILEIFNNNTNGGIVLWKD